MSRDSALGNTGGHDYCVSWTSTGPVGWMGRLGINTS
eukprot:gene28850-31331_t